MGAVDDNPYGGPLAVPSNPAWRFCPESARTPSPKPKYWPPQALAWPAQHRSDGFSPNAPVISRVPMKDFLAHQAERPTMPQVLPAVPKMPFGFRTPSPRRRIKSPPSIRGPPSPSPKSSDVSGGSGSGSGLSLGKSGYKYSAHGHRAASLPSKIAVTPPSSTSTTGSMDTTLPLTPNVDKYLLNKRGQKRGSDKFQAPSPSEHASSKAPVSPTVVTASASASAASTGSASSSGHEVSVKCEMNVSVGSSCKKSRRMF